MRLYTYLLKLQLLNALAYRFEYLSSIGRNLFFLLGSVFLWRTAYRGIDQVAGVTELERVCKTFRVTRKQKGLAGAVKGLFRPDRREVHAVRDVSVQESDIEDVIRTVYGRDVGG